MYHGSFQYTLLTTMSEHDVGVEYCADGEYVEITDITLHESRYMASVSNRSRYSRDKLIKNLKQKHIDDIYDKAVKINDGGY